MINQINDKQEIKMTIKEIQKFHNAPRELAKKELRQQARYKKLIFLKFVEELNKFKNDK